MHRRFVVKTVAIGPTGATEMHAVVDTDARPVDRFGRVRRGLEVKHFPWAEYDSAIAYADKLNDDADR
jgi:hypothetical protein